MAVETVPFIRAVGRMIRAAGRRVAIADEIELGELYALREVLNQAITEAEDGQLASGRSLSYIASATGVSKQAVHARRARRQRKAAA